jgi:poly(3-hydroxybutyrate) depolymerase
VSEFVWGSEREAVLEPYIGTSAPVGKQTLSVNFGGTTLPTFTYRPAGEIKGVLLAFHDAGRNGADYRDYAKHVADTYGLYVVAPEFSERAFSDSEYHLGGIVADGRLLPQDQWTVSLVDDIAAWAHAQVGNDPNDETIAYGHSAGGQFLSRIAAFGPDIFDKMIIANPSTQVRASLEEDVSYGFDGFFSSAEEEAMLKDYLADPVTIYLGSADNDPHDPSLWTNEEAMRQGDNRLARGTFVYNEAKALAAAKGWAFNWELVVADGVGHPGDGMLDAPAFQQAFDGRPGPHTSAWRPTIEFTGPYNGTSHADHIKGSAGNDKVYDFKAVDDVILLKGQVFSELAKGYLSHGAFTIGSAAKDASDHIVYNKKTGVLSYDKDGHGGADATPFAKLVHKPSISADDFYVY